MINVGVGVGVLLAVVAAPGADAESSPLREWSFIYVMSYDNNLDGCTEIISDGLEAGVKTDRVAVTVLSDRLDTKGLSRLVMTQGVGIDGTTESRHPGKTGEPGWTERAGMPPSSGG